MKHIKLGISGLHASALADHLLIVLKQFISGKKPGNISEEHIALLSHIDQVYQKLVVLAYKEDDETVQELGLNIEEAAAVLKAFTAPEFKQLAESDPFYQQNTYTSYFNQIYAAHLEEISTKYVEALAA